jgi:hypothetical protein
MLSLWNLKGLSAHEKREGVCDSSDLTLDMDNWYERLGSKKLWKYLSLLPHKYGRAIT